jgi:hypothetical protein
MPKSIDLLQTGLNWMFYRSSITQMLRNALPRVTDGRRQIVEQGSKHFGNKYIVRKLQRFGNNFRRSNW